MCLRCRVIFDTETDLARHVKQEVRCDLRESPSEEETLFITQDQEKELKKRSSRKKGDKERWNNVFRVIFPDVPVDQIPSPCKSSFQPHGHFGWLTVGKTRP
jgi:hypothetical protein